MILQLNQHLYDLLPTKCTSKMFLFKEYRRKMLPWWNYGLFYSFLLILVHFNAKADAINAKNYVRYYQKWFEKCSTSNRGLPGNWLVAKDIAIRAEGQGFDCQAGQIRYSDGIVARHRCDVSSEQCYPGDKSRR